MRLIDRRRVVVGLAVVGLVGALTPGIGEANEIVPGATTGGATGTAGTLLVAGPGVSILEEVRLAGDMVLARTNTGFAVLPVGSLLSREVELDKAANEGTVRNMVKPPEPADTRDLWALAAKHREAGWTTDDYGRMLDRAVAGESLQDIARTTTPAAALGSRTFGYAGVSQYFTVPQGVTEILIEAWGASGGDSADGVPGGRGGYARGLASVTPGQMLEVNVGGQGTRSGTGAWNGGGRRGGGSWTVPADGGGASDVRTGYATSTRLIIAGGGGGAAHSRGGDGGSPAGDNAPNNGYNATSQGAQGGVGGHNLLGGGDGGLGYCGTGFDGATANGGQGGYTSGFAGGGGGGGLNGGGGGGAGCSYGGAGGGGGSSGVGSVLVTGANFKTGVRVGHGFVIISWTPDAMATAAAESEVFNDGCRLDQDFVLNPPPGGPPPRIYRNYGCYDRRYGQQDSSGVYIGDHSFSTGRTYNDWWLKGVRVLHDYVNGQMVAFDPISTEYTDCSTHTVGYSGYGLSTSFSREICPTKIDPITSRVNYTTAWSGTSSGDTEAVHQAGTLKKPQGVASGYLWDQEVTVRACPNPLLCTLDNLIFGS